ncbi:MAG: bifunctional glutamate N-acetyltransferase/amino-acid acetyltransferase ArgJ [Verrucomicrobiota bacterium]
MAGPIEMLKGVTPLPAGFRAAALACGIKDPKKKKTDLALLVSDEPTVAAASFTTNRIKAAPVRASMLHIRNEEIRAMIVNSGNANACNGPNGIVDARKICKAVGKELGLRRRQVFICSTGIIGVPLPVENIRDSIPDLVGKLGSGGWNKVAKAILTSDTKKKVSGAKFKVGQKEVTLTGIAKGAGMINPNMATMLAFIATDVAITKEALQQSTHCAVDESFNRITIDGDMSTNDTVLVMANGTAGNRRIELGSRSCKLFREALTCVMLDLAKQIVKDGERVTKFVEVHVRGAASFQDAQKVAEAVANSALVKCSWNGSDPNWGRIMDVIGYSGARVSEQVIDIFFDGLAAARNGMASDTPINELKRVVSAPELRVVIDLHLGDADHTVFTTDISEGYVAFNRQEYAEKVKGR